MQAVPHCHDNIEIVLRILCYENRCFPRDFVKDIQSQYFGDCVLLLSIIFYYQILSLYCERIVKGLNYGNVTMEHID